MDDVHTNGQHPPARRLRVTPASAIRPRPVAWLWQHGGAGRIPTGALTITAGREGTGKSSFGVWLSARLTHGELHGVHDGIPSSVFYVAVEDSWEQTITPRLIAAGADLDRVFRLDVVTDADHEVELSLPYDNAALERAINEYGVRLVVVDPLMSVINGRIDTHRERDVRTALDPLARIADRTGAAILGIAHFNKSSGTDPAQLITGSGAFRNVPRAVFGFAVDQENGERVLSQVKNSLGVADLSLSYEIEPVSIATDEGIAETSKLTITGVSERNVSDLLRDASGDDEDRSERDEAAAWLRRFLEDRGGSEERKVIMKAAKEADFTESTLKRARKRAGVVADRRGFVERGGSQSIWVLSDSVSLGSRSGRSDHVSERELSGLSDDPSDERKEV